MKEYVIEWTGTITRDIGWEYVKASDLNDARKVFETTHGTNRKIRAVCEVEGTEAALAHILTKEIMRENFERKLDNDSE